MGCLEAHTLELETGKNFHEFRSLYFWYIRTCYIIGKNELEKKKRQCRKMYLRKEGGKIKAGQERKRHQSLDYVTCKFYKA